MSYDDEQCPKRGPGLRHQPDDHLTCQECGLQKTSGFTLADWLRAFRGWPMPPRVVKVSGEKPCEDDEKDKRPDNFGLLSEWQWHALEVERWYRDNHPDPDDQP